MLQTTLLFYFKTVLDGRSFFPCFKLEVETYKKLAHVMMYLKSFLIKLNVCRQEGTKYYTIYVAPSFYGVLHNSVLNGNAVLAQALK